MAFTAIRSGLQASSAEEDFQPYFVDNGCDGSRNIAAKSSGQEL